MVAKQRTIPAWQDAFWQLYQRTREVIWPVRPSSFKGMGAVPHADGTLFRVWAPHARRVTVSGSFNGWSRWRHSLSSEGNGYWSADVTAAQSGDAYKFVIHTGGRRLLRTDPYALAIQGPHGDGVIRVPHAAKSYAAPPFWMPKWNEMVIYELHVGTFAPQDGPPGDFDSVINKLPYLQNLGINAIELLPVAEFVGQFSWGYNPSHPFAVAQAYGGAEGLHQLVRAAHKHGIAVILDVVYNHFGPDNLDLWQFDGWQQNGMGGIYFYNDWRANTPWGDTRPDYGRSEVRQYLRDNALYWLQEFGIDGLRWDATAYIRNVHGHEGDPGSDIVEGWGLMRWVNDELNAHARWKISIAEDLRGSGAITRATTDDGAGFDTQWDERFVHPVRHAIIAADDDVRDMQAVVEAITARYNGDVFERVIYTESHDEVANGKARVPEEIAPGDAASLFARRRAVLGAALVLTSPGIPMLFQGQEFLEDGWFDDQNALDWGKAERFAGIVALYRDLIRLRRNVHGRTRGLTGQHVNIFHVDGGEKLIAFHRWSEGGAGDDVVVVANFANNAQPNYPLAFPHAGTWRVRFSSDSRAYDSDFGDTPSLDVTAVSTAVGGTSPVANIALGPYSVVIYSQDSSKQ